MDLYVLTCLSLHPGNVHECSTPIAAAASPDAGVEASASAMVGARYVDTLPWFCSAVCTPIVGHYVVYWDQAHVTETYARYLQNVLGTSLGLS